MKSFTCCLRDETYDGSIRCKQCKEYSHLKCAYLNRTVRDQIRRFVCDRCEQSTNAITQWKGRKANRKQRRLKLRKYFEVERIVRHKITDSGRKFRIQWKGYRNRHNTWEPEKHLDGSLDILQAYLRHHKLPLSKVEKLVGANKKVSHNIENWVTIDRIRDCIHRFRKHKSYELAIQVESWGPSHTCDKIYLYEHESHCYIILYIHSRETGYIADGANIFINDLDVQTEIKNLLQIKLIPIFYERPLRADFCGSSAVFIALDFNRCYKKKELPLSLTTPKSLRQNITNLLHKHSSDTIDKKTLNDFASWVRCPNCSKNFRSDNRSRLNQHLKFCRSKN